MSDDQVPLDGWYRLAAVVGAMSESVRTARYSDSGKDFPAWNIFSSVLPRPGPGARSNCCNNDARRQDVAELARSKAR